MTAFSAVLAATGAFGIVDDDAVVDVEHTSRYLRSGGVRNSFGVAVFLVFVVLALCSFCLQVFRRFCVNKFGIDIYYCYASVPLVRPRNTTVDTNMQQDYEMAQRLQHQLNDEMREQEKQQKRKERLQWYEAYLKPYTMTAAEEDLFTSNEVDELAPLKEPHVGIDDDDGSHNHGAKPKRRFVRLESVVTTESSMCDNGDETDLDNTVKSFHKSGGSDTAVDLSVVVKNDEHIGKTEADHCEDCVSKDEAEENDESSAHGSDLDNLTVSPAHRCVRLPCKNGPRSVDAHCAICLGEYEAGDKISWSDLECQHAFHYECILPWLTKGKKRCPMCRHWFVPGTKIDDQRRAAEEAAAAASSQESSRFSEDEEEIDNHNSNGDDESNNAARLRIMTTDTELTVPVSGVSDDSHGNDDSDDDDDNNNNNNHHPVRLVDRRTDTANDERD